MIRLGVIAPDMEIYAKVPALAADLGLGHCVEVHHARWEQALAIARNMEQSGVDVIVCRGTTYEFIQSSGVRTPLVNIPLSVHDLSSVLSRAKALTGLARPRIVVVTYPRIDLDLMAIASLLDANIQLYPSGHTRETFKAVCERALRERADVVVGGLTTKELLDGCNILFLPLRSGDNSIIQALLEAQQIALARRLEQEQTLQLKVVVDTTKDGVVVLDSLGCIKLANEHAVKLLDIPQDCVDKNLLDLCPQLKLNSFLDGSDSFTDELVHIQTNPLLVSLIPIVRQDRSSGAVLRCQPAREIVELEAKIRKKLPEKGLVARYSFADIAGISSQILSARSQAEIFAATSDPVLLTGETGTGKELFAQGIHLASARRDGPFVAVNCAALPPALLESELFGYEDGAFTGASRKGKAGLFELAHRGTIFLDEISGLDLYGQTRLLRVLQEGNVLRLGSDKYQRVDFRVIAASNEDLFALSGGGAFRKDLFYRLSVLRLALPPLRAREGDVVHLIRNFVRQFRQNKEPAFSARALARLESHDWPGNIRELQQVAKRLCLLFQDRAVFEEEDVLAALEQQPACDALPHNVPEVGYAPADKADAAREEILLALRRCGYKQSEAARALGINASTLYRRMKRLGIRKVVT